jgi:hypothetical protein
MLALALIPAFMIISFFAIIAASMKDQKSRVHSSEFFEVTEVTEVSEPLAA